MQIWAISDTHFGHEKMVSEHRGPSGEFVRGRFKDAAEVDAFIFHQVLSRVKPGDHVYHLGDVALKRPHLETAARLIKLSGAKWRLIRGNRDIFKTKDYLKAGFQEIHAMRILENVLFTHIPVHPGAIAGVERQRTWVGNAHGHMHDHPAPPGLYLNISVERTDYAPVSVESVAVILRHKRAALEQQARMLLGEEPVPANDKLLAAFRAQDP